MHLIYEKYIDAWKSKELESYLDYYHEDWRITFHATGKVMKLEELSENSGNWMVTGKFEHQRCIYENADILVTHNIATFENGSREAILQSILKKDGLLWREETGATPLPSKTF